MSELISKDAALDCFHDWIDRYGNEHTADEDATYQRVEALEGVGSCEDAISRQAAIDAMGKAKWAKERLEELPSAQPEQRWIPCSERMPKESGQYLITVKYEHVDGYEDIYAEHGDWDGEEWDMFCFGHCGKVEGIVAWMPLPEPYKGGEK